MIPFTRSTNYIQLFYTCCYVYDSFKSQPLCVFITANVNCFSRELYKSMTSTVTFNDYSTESLDSSGFEDAERLKVSIVRNVCTLLSPHVLTTILVGKAEVAEEVRV